MSRRVKRILGSTRLAPALGPYSPGVQAGDFVFAAQGPISPATGRIIGPDLADQVTQTLENLELVLVEAGCDRTNIVQVTAYLADMTDYDLFNELYAAFFRKEFPCRVTVGVTDLPPRIKIEVSAVAYKPAIDSSSDD